MGDIMSEPTLDPRLRQVLLAVIAEYVETAQPVGSRSVARRHVRGLSPATIRNAMADLEDTGWVTARALTPMPRPSVEELREIGRILTRRYRGKTFQAIVEDIERPADPLDPLWTRSRGLLDQIVGLLRDRNLYISGAINLLDHPDLSDVGTMRGLLPAFEEKARLVELLTRMAEERGVQVLIG